MRFHKFNRQNFFPSIALLAMVGCSSNAASTIPRETSQQSILLPSSSFQNPIVKSIFASAVNKPLSADSDYDQFIDSSVTGNDRITARKFMRFMPPNLRGDFVYYDGSHVVSNNNALIQQSLTMSPQTAASSPSLTSQAFLSRALVSQKRTTQSVGGCEPPYNITTGPWVRMVSNCGFSGGWTVANLPCGETNLTTSTSSGIMYLELRDQNGGNLYEAGLEVPARSGGDTSINPYLANIGLQLNNATGRYSCGTDLVVFAGLVPVAGSVPQFFAMMGAVDGGWNSSLAYATEYTLTIDNPSWLFTNFTGDATPGTDPVGVPTACTGCSITKLTSIAQAGGATWLDGSTFGINSSGQPNIFWKDIRFGEWLQGSDFALSTLQYSENSSAWYAGEDNWPNTNAAYASVDPNGGVVGYQSYDGVDTNGNILTLSQGRSASSFNIPAPPTCALDNHGYCIATTSTSDWAFLCSGGARGHFISPVIVTAYQVLNSRRVLSGYAHSVPEGCPSSATWSPSNPAISLNDPNLP